MTKPEIAGATTTFPPRLHVLLAREARVGVVFRRGPSKQVATLLWDRDADTFQLGQWLKGRIHERRSDLSPDGSLMIYFAFDGKPQGPTGGSWTAISRAPYLKALALYGKGDAWCGGGLFTGPDSYWLCECGDPHRPLREAAGLRRDHKFQPEGGALGESRGVYYPRLLRDGWTHAGSTDIGRWHDMDTFTKPLPGGWSLEKRSHGQVDSPVGKGSYWDEHRVVHAASGLAIEGADWEWADRDGDRLAWAAGGKLFAAQLDDHGLAEPRELADFNAMTFEGIVAPY